MSRSPFSRLLSRGLVQSRSSPITPSQPRQWLRPYSQTPTSRADPPSGGDITQKAALNALRLGSGLSTAKNPVSKTISETMGAAAPGQQKDNTPPTLDHWRPFKFSVYSHKQNTHVTVSKPNGDAIISMSCGNLGFRKSQRKRYDSAYQLLAFVLEQMYRDGWHEKINKLEVSLRGFGQGRQAAQKILLGYEGRHLKDKIVAVMDATPLKIGGTRAPNPRRV